MDITNLKLSSRTKNTLTKVAKIETLFELEKLMYDKELIKELNGTKKVTEKTANNIYEEVKKVLNELKPEKVCPMYEDGDCLLRAAVNFTNVSISNAFKDVECTTNNCVVEFLMAAKNT